MCSSAPWDLETHFHVLNWWSCPLTSKVGQRHRAYRGLSRWQRCGEPTTASRLLKSNVVTAPSILLWETLYLWAARVTLASVINRHRHAHAHTHTHTHTHTHAHTLYIEGHLKCTVAKAAPWIWTHCQWAPCWRVPVCVWKLWIIYLDLLKLVCCQ